MEITTVRPLTKYQQKLEEQKAKVRQKIKEKNSLANLSSVDPDIHKIATTYEQYLANYLHQPALKYLKNGWESDAKGLGIWQAVFDYSIQLNILPEEFLLAQFWFMDKYVGRAPKPQELIYINTKVPCYKRVELYYEARGTKLVNTSNSVISKVNPNPPQITEVQKELQSEKVLKDFMTNFGLTEEEVFIKYAPSAFMYFNYAWFINHPTYIRLKESNKI